jgi:large subunit ribosomal protein L18
VRLKYNKRSSDRVISRLKNKVRIRKRVSGTKERPRLCVYRSGRHIYGQIVDDVAGNTLVAASTLKTGGRCSKDGAKEVGMALAKAALEKNIKNVVFDRSGYIYHGRVKAIADGAREGGLNF